jgi:hypothetical protein
LFHFLSHNGYFFLFFPEGNWKLPVTIKYFIFVQAGGFGANIWGGQPNGMMSPGMNPMQMPGGMGMRMGMPGGMGMGMGMPGGMGLPKSTDPKTCRHYSNSSFSSNCFFFFSVF